jgi:hypothetical protein
MIDSLPTPIAMYLAVGDPLMREDLSITQQKAPHGMCTTLKDRVNDARFVQNIVSGSIARITTP